MSWSAFDTFTDPDAYHAAISSAYARSRSDGVVTARGNFRADFARIQLDRVLLRHARETLPRTAYSAMDPRQFLIAFTTDPRQQIYVSGLELVPDAIVVFRAASEGYNRYSASRWSGIALPHEDVAAAGQTLIGRELIAPPNTHVIKPPRPFFSKLLKLDKAVRHLAKAAPEVLASAEVARALDQAVTRVMIQCLSEGQGIEKVGSAHWRHAAVMRRLENFLEANPDRTLHMTDLCAAAAASDRTLRILCHEHLGMSPTRYLWLRRMHLARRALRMADPTTTTVTEIATSYAFWELGRFAVAYRSLFGETPSATLGRPPEDPRRQNVFGSPWRLPESA